MREYRTKICKVSTGQNLPEPEGAYPGLEQSSLQQATDAFPLSAAAAAMEEAPSCLESAGTPLGALEVLIALGSAAMETHSVPGLPAFLAQQRLLAEAGPLNSSIDTVSRKVPICFPTTLILPKPIRVWHLS